MLRPLLCLVPAVFPALVMAQTWQQVPNSVPTRAAVFDASRHRVLLVLVADVAGHARLAVPIPADLSLRGISLLAQAVVFDPPRSVFGGLTFTDGLRIDIGD